MRAGMDLGDAKEFILGGGVIQGRSTEVVYGGLLFLHSLGVGEIASMWKKSYANLFTSFPRKG